MVIGLMPSPSAENLPSSYFTSSGFFSQVFAARSLSWRNASCAAL